MTEPTEPIQPLFCRNCGNKYKKEDAKFCSVCGTSVKKSEEVPQSATQRSVSENQESNSMVPITPGSNSVNASEYSTPIAYPSNTTPRTISDTSHGVGVNSFSRSDTKPLVYAITIAVFSHILKIMLLYNRFPTALEFIWMIPLYIIFLLVVYFFTANYYNGKGVYVKHESDPYDLVHSLVLSSFFLSHIPLIVSTDFEKSKLNDNITITVKQGNLMGYVEIPKKAYVKEHLGKTYQFWFEFWMMIISLILLFSFANNENVTTYVSLRILTTYVAGIVVTDLAPIFGRHNAMVGSLHRIRTFLVFLIGIFVFTVSIFDIFLESIF